MPTDKNKQRVLLITRNLPPLVGGMERLMQNLAAGVAEYAELTVIGPSGCAKHLPGNVQVRETSEKLVPFLLFSSWLGIRACRQVKFDIVIGGSGLLAPVLSVLARFFSCKTIIYLHGLDLVINNFIYQRTFVPCMRTIDQVVVNSRNTGRIAMGKGIEEARIVIINPGTTLPAIPGDDALAEFRARHNIRYQKIMLFVGRMTSRKGLSRFIRNSLPGIVKAEPTAGLLVVGKNPNDSLNQLGEEREVLAAVSDLQLGDRVTFLGQVSEDDLLASYAVADVQVFPLVQVEGDVEGFGMVAIEAAALGTPTVAFDVGGVSDAVSAHNGQLIPAGNYNALTDGLVRVLQDGIPGREECVRHAQHYTWEHFHQKIRRVVQRQTTH